MASSPPKSGLGQHWIQGMDMKKGALRQTASSEGGMGSNGKIKPGWLQQKAAGGGTTGKRARLAETFKKMH